MRIRSSIVHIAIITMCMAVTPIRVVSAEDAVIDDVWQYSLLMGAGTDGPAKTIDGTYLWIPKDAKRIRAIFLANLWAFDAGLLQSKAMRESLARNGVAALLITQGAGVVKDNAIVPEVYEGIRKRLATISGYPEIEKAPVFVTGYSATGGFPGAVIRYDAQSVLGVAAYEAGKVDTSKARGIPMLFGVGTHSDFGVSGHAFPFQQDRNYSWLMTMRSKDLDLCAGLLMNCSGTHLYFAEKIIPPYAMFIDKVCRYRLPKDMASDGATVLKDVRLEDGWLMDSRYWLETGYDRTAPYASYKGNKEGALWYIDEEMARTCEEFQRGECRKKMQLITFVDNGIPIDNKESFMQKLVLRPIDDRMTFSLAATFLDEPPAPVKGTWPINSFSHSKEKIKFRCLWGPLEKTSDNTFRRKYSRYSTCPQSECRFDFVMAYVDGDAEFRGAERSAVLTIPACTAGEEQRLEFPDIPDVGSRDVFVPLRATASSGLPVEYFVVGGPAMIDGDHLRITDIPVNARYPMRVTVGAYQIGRWGDRPIKETRVLYRSFFIKDRVDDVVAADTAAQHDLQVLTYSANAKAKISQCVMVFSGKYRGMVHGREVAMDARNKDVKPILVQDEMLVPVGFVAEAFGKAVALERDGESITVASEAGPVRLRIDERQIRSGTELKPIPVPAQRIDGTVMVPLGALSSAMKKEVFVDKRGLMAISDIPVFDVKIVPDRASLIEIVREFNRVR